MSMNTYWWCFVAQLWFSPSTNDLRFLSAATVGRWPLCNAICFLCLERTQCVFVAESVGCHVICASMNGREVCRCYHEQLKNLYSTPGKHLHLLFSERNRLNFKTKNPVCYPFTYSTKSQILFTFYSNYSIFLDNFPLEPTVQIVL